MYRKAEQNSKSAEDFELPFAGRLVESNRWMQLAQLIPWSEFEEEYAQNFETETGPPTKSFRLALAALIIKEKLGISVRETVEPIRENPYLQYFCGYLKMAKTELLTDLIARISVKKINFTITLFDS